MSSIISLVIKYLPYLVQASKSVPEVITFISNIRAIFARTKTWTPEEEAAFDASLEDLKTDPYWKSEV